MIYARIAGTGAYLPERIMPNSEFAERLGLDTSDAWIRERTGIKRRHIAADDETTTTMPLTTTLLGELFSDDRILSVAHAFQKRTDWHLRRPPLDG